MDFSVRKNIVGLLAGLVIFSAFSGIQVCYGCTIITVSNRDVAWAGNNEDYIEPRTKIWLFAASDGVYGRMLWGYDRYLYKYQGGMNDQGLFVDINAVGFTDWRDDPEKPDFEEDVIEYILTQFATVDEVIDFFQHHDVDLGYVKFVVADEWGESAIFEWGRGKLQIVMKDGDYQISTNFVQSEYVAPEDYSCRRYRIADRILQSQAIPTVDLIRRVLSATCAEAYFTRTLYSTICDLKERTVYLYHYHNFEEVVVFDLNEELSKGNRSYAIPSLFDVRPYSEVFSEQYGSQLGARDLMKIIEEQGVDRGIEEFHAMKVETRTIHRYVFEQWLLKSMGISFLSKNRIKEAIEIFKLNCQSYPESWDAYFQLAEAYMKNGDTSMALLNYQKALERNPDDSNIQRIVNEIK